MYTFCYRGRSGFDDGYETYGAYRGRSGSRKSKCYERVVANDNSYHGAMAA